MIWPELVPRDNEAGNRTTKKVPALRMDPVECGNRGGSPQGQKGYQADCLEVLITICYRNGIAEETTRKITDPWMKSTRDI